MDFWTCPTLYTALDQGKVHSILLAKGVSQQEVQSTGQIIQLERTIGQDGKPRPAAIVFWGGSPASPGSSRSN